MRKYVGWKEILESWACQSARHTQPDAVASSFPLAERANCCHERPLPARRESLPLLSTFSSSFAVTDHLCRSSSTTAPVPTSSSRRFADLSRHQLILTSFLLDFGGPSVLVACYRNNYIEAPQPPERTGTTFVEGTHLPSHTLV